MSSDIKLTQSRVTEEALSGRLPLRSSERVYNGYGSFLWTCTAFSAATWAFLIGGFLPYVGDVRVGVLGYLAGMLIGMAVVVLASGLPSFKYGVEPIDAAKASFGPYGIVLPLFGLLATCVGWTYVVVALTARGAANVLQTVEQSEVATAEPVVIGLALFTMFAVWLVASKGPWLFERISNYIAPGHILVTVVMFAILLYHYGAGLWTLQVPADQRLASTPGQGFALAVEFGISNSLTWWPIMGGLTRLVKRRSHIVGPSVVGVGVLGAAFISMVAAFAALSAGTPDPTIWMIKLAGPALGSLIMTFVLAANIATMVIMLYLAGVSIQQIKPLTRVRWDILIALMLLPGVYVAFRTEWTLSIVMSWLSYNGVMFVGITGVTFVDYFILRKETLAPAHLFSRDPSSKYWFWGGVNWVAVIISVLSVALYLYLYNPVTTAMHPLAHTLGAGIPTVVVSGIAYYLIMRMLVIPSGKGGYKQAGSATTSPEVIPTL
ncbi:cytosine permease [Rhizobium sp. CNPSo 3490]|uniref:cytosine permease n=1 Tax=Rhizobium sp. CNPSo 3490 TaxID=3021407 RepID=UPI00254E18F6|nr:cytosine permease [Rhizobium sp. CNPSo 3490]MDK4731998.1 cytosine permease [Rhizobium sp. CNPSo 3490]